MADRGYYATLGVSFDADDTVITKAYKKKALKLHPDKNPGPSAVEEFQKITTSCEPAPLSRQLRPLWWALSARCAPPRSLRALPAEMPRAAPRPSQTT